MNNVSKNSSKKYFSLDNNKQFPLQSRKKDDKSLKDDQGLVSTKSHTGLNDEQQGCDNEQPSSQNGRIKKMGSYGLNVTVSEETIEKKISMEILEIYKALSGLTFQYIAKDVDWSKVADYPTENKLVQIFSEWSRIGIICSNKLNGKSASKINYQYVHALEQSDIDIRNDTMPKKIMARKSIPFILRDHGIFIFPTSELIKFLYESMKDKGEVLAIGSGYGLPEAVLKQLGIKLIANDISWK